MEESDKIKLKFDAIWKARESELNAVRERTLLAWGFIMFCYGGYGYLAHSLLTGTGFTEVRFSAFNLAMFVLSLICFRLSLYWVQIAKGAKAWAENMDFIAEGFQHLFARNNGSCVSCPFKTEEGRNNSTIPQHVFIDKDCANCQGDPSYACVFSVTDPTRSLYYCDVDENILTSKAGAFSPAAAMVSIARLSLLISLLLCIGHIVCLIFGKEGTKDSLHPLSGKNSFGLTVVIALLLAVFLLVPIVGWFVRRIYRWHATRNIEKKKYDFCKRRDCKWKWVRDAFLYSSNVSMGMQDNQIVRETYGNGFDK